MSADSKIKILEYFFKNPQEEIHIRALARQTNLHPNTIITAVESLEKDNLLQKKEDAFKSAISAVRSKPFFHIRKRAYNIEKLYREGLITYLQEEYFQPTIILFGSIAKGDERAESDIDLFILTDSPHEVDLQKYEKRIGRQIQLFTHNKKQWKNICTKQPELANNIINGIVLEGFLEVLS